MLKEIKVPDLGNISDAAIIEVAVKAGATINKEDTLITLESDKASMDIPAPEAGVVKEVKVKVGDKVKTGSLILTLEVTGDAAAAAPASSAPTKAGETSTPATTTAAPAPVAAAAPVAPAPVAVTPEAPKVSAAVASTGNAEVHASPIVRRIAREFGVDLGKVNASGPKGRILKEDVQAFVKSALAGGGSSAGGAVGFPAPPVVDFSQFGAIENKPLSRIKKLTAINLHRNWVLIPHVTQFEEADITELEAFRKAQQAALEKQGIKLTPLVFIMKAVVNTLKAFPTFNASLDPSGEQLILKKYFHIGVAVDTPDGLVVPVIRDVDKKGLVELAKELAEVSNKARAKALAPQDMQGSSFTISSLGGIGGTGFTPIVNLPDVAILGVSKAAIKPVYQQDQFVPRLMLPLSLSYDHRVIDGAEGARFIVHLAAALADMRRWLL